MAVKITCPHCGADVGAATCVTDPQETTPADGDMAMCLSCAELYIFTAGGTILRKATHEEVNTLPPDLKRDILIAKGFRLFLKGKTQGL